MQYGASTFPLPRGLVTSLAANAAFAVVLISQSTNQIFDSTRLEIARVQPRGRFWTPCATRAETHQLTFAPAPSTHTRAHLRKDSGTLRAGQHSLLGGNCPDNVDELRILLYKRRHSYDVSRHKRNRITDIITRVAAAAIFTAFAAQSSPTQDKSARCFPQIPHGSPSTIWMSCYLKGVHVARALV